MIAWLRDVRSRHYRRQAFHWVSEMLDDPQGNMPGAQRWLARGPEQRRIYREVVSEIGKASDQAHLLPELRELAAHADDPAFAPTIARKRLPLATIAVACVAAAILVAFAAFERRSSRPAANTPYFRAIPAMAGSRTVRLPDGSAVVADGNSPMQIDFKTSERSVHLLGGRASFSVQHEDGRSFVVYAGGGTVTATGTEFEVSANQAVSVRLISGTVRVTLPRSANKPESRTIYMSAGEQISFEPATPAQAVAAHPSATRTSFDGVPLSTIVAQANQNSVTKIVIADPDIASRRIFAEIDISDMDGMVHKLATLFDLTIDRSVPGEVRLTSKK